MNSKRIILVRNLLKASSIFNTFKYTSDKKKKNKVVGYIVAYAVIYTMFAAYGITAGIGMGAMGIPEIIPSLCAITLIAAGFFLTLLKTNGYLFAFKEYDMLISMPFEIRDVVASKFIFMYVKSIPLLMVISVSILIGYVFGNGFDLLAIIIWVGLSFVLPIIPMLVASALGAVFIRVSSVFKNKKIIQTVLTFAFIIFCFSFRFIIEKVFRDDMVEDVVENLVSTVRNTEKYLPIAKWFAEAVNEKRISSICILIGLSILLFELFFYVVARSYREVNSRIATGKAHKTYKMHSQKKRSMISAIAFKEFKRMTGSTTYLTNVGIGAVMAFIMGVVVLFVKAEKVIETVMNGAPIEPQMLIPAIPIIVYFFLGMVPSTCCSPSLEGKSEWIIKSMPIEEKTDYKGKILFNLLLTIPVGIFAVISFSICFRSSIINTIFSIITIFVQCTFSSVFGLMCGIKYKKTDWDNEVEVIKQGPAVVTYLLPNMFASMLLLPGVVVLNYFLENTVLILAIVIAIYSVLTVLIGARLFSSRNKKKIYNKKEK